MIKAFLDKFKSKRVQTATAVVLITILITLIYYTYDEYRKTIVNQQLENMLGNSKSISRSIELFVNDTVDSMKIFTLDNEFIKNIPYIEQGTITGSYMEKIRTYYEAGGKEIDSVYFIDKGGKVLTRYPQGTGDINDGVTADISAALAKRSTYIGNAYLDKEKQNFILNIYEPVFEKDEFKGIVSAAINLSVIYDKMIAPVKIGEKGYAMVKDQKGIIIMHTVKEQVGMDVIETRKQVYPDLDYKELESLINVQLKGEEGTAVYHSYWWGDNVLKRAKKLNAYTPAKLGEHFWIVALTMSYDELQGPINRFLVKVIGIVSLIIIIIYFFVIALIKMKKNKEELEKETRYLKRLNETSEQLRKEEAELYHSHKLKMIGTLAGGIAHDINNLLTPILGYSELLLMQVPKSEDHYEEIEEIYRASQKGKDLVEQILLFSRKDNGIIKVEPIDINEVIRDTIKLLESVTPKNVVITDNIKENCGYVNANFTQLHQVIFNLCTNGYQAIKSNKGTLEICLDTISGERANEISNVLSADRRYAQLEVKDSGIGMDEETKDRIFDPFFTTKGVGEGTGLGLFVVQSIIDKYEGAITVESKIGVGSSFKVFLPLIDETADLHQHNTSKENNESSNKRILLVDDNEDIIKVLKVSLKHMGYEITSKADSTKALELFKSKPESFDLVITDFMMPNLKGSELAANIKEINKAVKVILITGYMDESLEALNDSDTIDACIAKPVEITKLSEAINNLLFQMP